MLTLSMGLAAALLWGIHDLCVRRLSRGSDIAASMLVVLLVGTLCLLPPMGWSGESGFPRGQVLLLNGLSGVLFAAATYGLWRAFGSGPVRIVAPITAAFPVVSLSLAVIAGETVTGIAWAAVAVVIVGVAIVASGEADTDETFDMRTAIGWSVATAVAFALTFAVGQSVMASEPVLPVLVVTRLVAAVVVIAWMSVSGGLRWPTREALPTLAAMGALDAGALGLVLYAGRFDNASYATVTASLFGVVTILLAAVFLRERLTVRQCCGIAVTFAAIGVLGSIVE